MFTFACTRVSGDNKSFPVLKEKKKESKKRRSFINIEIHRIAALQFFENHCAMYINTKKLRKYLEINSESNSSNN